VNGSFDFHAGTGRSALLFMLVAFVATFAVTRTVVRLIRSGRGPFGNLEANGVHIHHLVPGIFLMLLAAPLEFVLEPHGTPRDLLAGLFGVGAALTLDEFALWLHLTDVYWEQEGRKSVDAVVGVACLGVLGLFATNSFSRHQGESDAFFVGLALLQIGLALAAVLKGRVVLGVGGLLVPFLSLFGALRLARPGSPWFRWFYPPDSPKAARATRRAARRGVSGRVKGAISGMPPKTDR
jgi:hypothetical protein